jgi:Ca2+:H+ antiporter
MKLMREPLYWLLLAVPVAVALRLLHVPDLWLFVATCVAIIPLAGLMGRATEALADSLGAAVGGLLNATFGNAAELIIALMMLRRGAAMHPMIRASLTGSVIGNVLLVLGAAILVGGFFHKRQVFNRTAAGLGTTLLALASIGLLVPTLYYYVFHAGAAPNEAERQTVESLSVEIAAVLAVVYGLSLLFSLHTHQHLFARADEGAGGASKGHSPHWGRRTALLVLAAATAGVAVMSELLVGALEPAAHALGWNDVFVGVIVVAVVGNAAEHSTAVMTAVKNRMDLSVSIAVGSSLQVALFVAPILVFTSLLPGMGPPLDLHFSPMEVIAMGLSVGVLGLVSHDGESHWLEGALLLAVYVIFALAFYHLPPAAR